MSSFKTEIKQIQVKGKIQTIEVKSTVLGYVSKGLQGKSAYQVAVDNGFIGTEEEWLASLIGPIGPIGPDGIPVEIRTTDTYIQWKYINDITWTNIIALSALIGPQGIKGNEIQLRTNETHIQWKYDNEEEWTNLIALSELQGPQGLKGDSGDSGVYYGDTEPNDPEKKVWIDPEGDTTTTDNLPEGVNNLYFTETRSNVLVKGNSNINNTINNIFVGTQAEYDSLPNKTGILAIIEE